jgi:hypothetical protein
MNFSELKSQNRLSLNCDHGGCEPGSHGENKEISFDLFRNHTLISWCRTVFYVLKKRTETFLTRVK